MDFCGILVYSCFFVLFIYDITNVKFVQILFGNQIGRKKLEKNVKV